MTEPPSYPETSGNQTQHTPPMGEKRSRTNMVILLVLVGAILILMIALHLAGVVGPGTKM